MSQDIRIRPRWVCDREVVKKFRWWYSDCVSIWFCSTSTESNLVWHWPNQTSFHFHRIWPFLILTDFTLFDVYRIWPCLTLTELSRFLFTENAASRTSTPPRSRGKSTSRRIWASKPGLNKMALVWKITVVSQTCDTCKKWRLMNSVSFYLTRYCCWIHMFILETYRWIVLPKFYRRWNIFP